MEMPRLEDSSIPIVRCPASTMAVDEPPPELSSQVQVRIPPRLANKLAYYKGPLFKVVLAPRGWTCNQYAGTGASTFLIAPDGAGVLRAEQYPGPQIAVRVAIGATSGRFEVAKISARLFSILSDFIERVRGEKLDEISDEPFPGDTYYYLSPTVVKWDAQPTGDGVVGLAYLSGHKAEPTLTLMQVRLGADSQELVPAILGREISE